MRVATILCLLFEKSDDLMRSTYGKSTQFPILHAVVYDHETELEA